MASIKYKLYGLLILSFYSCNKNIYYVRPETDGIVYNSITHQPIAGCQLTFIYDNELNELVLVERYNHQQDNEGESFISNNNGIFTIPAIKNNLPYQSRKYNSGKYSRKMVIMKDGYISDTLRLPSSDWSIKQITMDTILLKPKMR